MHLRRLCQEGNKWVSLGTGGAAIKGLYDSHPHFNVDSIPEIAFFIFIVFFRIKLYLDDEIFFISIADYTSKNFKIGMIFAVISWVFIFLSAFSIGTVNNSYLYCLFSIAISTLWIVAEAFRVGAYREQNIWIATNSLYMSMLAFLIWLKPENSPYYEWGGLFCLNILLIFDYTVSRSLDKLHLLEKP